MSKKLKSFLFGINLPTVIIDENGEYRISKATVNKNNDICIRYYLPINKNERKYIKTHKNDSTPQITVYE